MSAPSNFVSQLPRLTRTIFLSGLNGHTWERTAPHEAGFVADFKLQLFMTTWTDDQNSQRAIQTCFPGSVTTIALILQTSPCAVSWWESISVSIAAELSIHNKNLCAPHHKPPRERAVSAEHFSVREAVWIICLTKRKAINKILEGT